MPSAPTATSLRTMADPPADDPPTRVLIVEGHPVLRGVMRIACDEAPNLRVVGEAEDAPAARRLLEEASPGACVIDLDLEDYH